MPRPTSRNASARVLETRLPSAVDTFAKLIASEPYDILGVAYGDLILTNPSHRSTVGIRSQVGRPPSCDTILSHPGGQLIRRLFWSRNRLLEDLAGLVPVNAHLVSA